jgi:hypothetical protein
LPFFERHGSVLIVQQTVVLRGQRFANFRVEKSVVASPPADVGQ